MTEGEQSPQPETPPPASEARGRILLVAGVASVLLIGLIVILNSGGGTEHEFTAAPERCIDGWNDDSSAPTGIGIHQYDVHGYNRVQVLTLSSDGARPASDPAAICTVVFASGALDPEPAAAAYAQLPGGWQALSGLQPPDRLAEYQAQAQAEYNATIGSDGLLEPL